jgi:hypothetical protein
LSAWNRFESVARCTPEPLIPLLGDVFTTPATVAERHDYGTILALRGAPKMNTTGTTNARPRRPILRLVTPAAAPQPAAPKLAASRDARWRWTPPASSPPAKPAPSPLAAAPSIPAPQPSPQPAEVPRAAPRRRAPRAAKPTPYDVLRDRFPVFRSWLPLKVGIRADLAAAAPDLRADVLLCRHTRTLAYLRAVAAGGPRYGLDAQPAGSVSPDEQAYAAMQLARLRGDKQ